MPTNNHDAPFDAQKEEPDHQSLSSDPAQRNSLLLSQSPQRSFPGYQTWTSTANEPTKQATGQEHRSPLVPHLESTQPRLITPPPARRGKRRIGTRSMIALVLLAILVIAGGFIGQRFIGGQSVLPTTPSATQTGPFVQAPLSAIQVDALQHLVTHMKYKQLASLYTARMSIDEELGQLIMVEYGDTTYSSDLDTMINQLHAGGVIMYEFQMTSFNQTKHDIAEMQKRANIPLLISADEEGGIVHRLLNIYPPRPSALAIYQTGNPDYAAQQGHKVAQDLLALGINTNLAPDVDVALIPNAPDQVTRTFGYTVDSVVKFAGPYIQAIQSDGVIACIKHFPGLGDASIDAHFGLPVVNRTKDELYSVELAPFKHFIQSPDKLEQPGMIMPTDVLMPAIDPVMPAELSHTFMTDILRHQFGYDGVVLTDALYMKGVTVNGASISMPQAAVMAINAGDDMLLGPTGTGQMLDMINALKTAYLNGTISKSRIDEAVTRILTLKMERKLMPAVPPQS